MKIAVILTRDQSIEVDIDNPIDSPICVKSERDRCPIDFVYCNICLTAIYVGNLLDDDILCSGCKAEVEYLRSIILRAYPKIR
jgi:hypothetical protein